MSIITSPSDPDHDHHRVSSSNNNNNYKSRFHRRNQSEELDIFEATKYFSGDNYDHHDIVSNRSFKASSITFSDREKKILKENSAVREERKFQGLENIIPPDHAVIKSNVVVLAHDHDHQMEKQMIKIKEVKKVKQPSSPGGKLANLLTSLFLSHSPSHHLHSKKKAKSSSTKKSIMKDTEHHDHQIISPCGIRRKRRNSINDFQSSTTTAASAIDCSNNNRHVLDEKKITKVEKKKKKKKNLSNGYAEKDRIWAYKYPSEESELLFRNNNLKEVNHNSDHVDQRELESDSSSDLFELPINDSSSSSTGDLPVYETTNYMESIKKLGISSF